MRAKPVDPPPPPNCRNPFLPEVRDLFASQHPPLPQPPSPPSFPVFPRTAPSPPLLVPCFTGMGKTSCALWLVRKTHCHGCMWLFVSLPSVHHPFAPNGLVRHLQSTFGIDERAMGELRQRPLVLVLDSLDEVSRATVPSQTFWDLNGFDQWNVRLIVTCRQEHVNDYGSCLGDPSRLFIQAFGPDHIRAYVRMRMHAHEGHAATGIRFGHTATSPARPTSDPTCKTSDIVESSEVEQRLDAMLADMQKSRIRKGYRVPFRLSMAMDLYLQQPEAGPISFGSLSRAAQLYDLWLRHDIRQKGGSGCIDEVMTKAQQLAWDLHCTDRVQAKVEGLGAEDWFRKCPLRVHDYHPESCFSFKHKSIQEYLAGLWVCRVKGRLGYTIEATKGSAFRTDAQDGLYGLHFLFCSRRPVKDGICWGVTVSHSCFLCSGKSYPVWTQDEHMSLRHRPLPAKRRPLHANRCPLPTNRRRLAANRRWFAANRRQSHAPNSQCPANGLGNASTHTGRRRQHVHPRPMQLSSLFLVKTALQRPSGTPTGCHRKLGNISG